ncbi:MAG TPA: hypothetical protein VLK33_19590 [Terriglobales bacterium]|nr:hypothetical protein [Terriglobales bacterium]
MLSEIAALKKEWRSAWEKKAEREFVSRLRQWSNYMAELSEKPSRHAAAYQSEVRVRALLELLADEVPALRSQLTGLDSKLKALTTESEFVWAMDVEAAFPKSKFWFLWVSPRAVMV